MIFHPLISENDQTLITGWWLSHPSEKYEFVSWDYCSQYMEKKMFQTTNQITMDCLQWFDIKNKYNYCLVVFRHPSEK